MPLLNEADAIYLGALEADRVYLGVNLVWPPAPSGAWGPDESLYPATAATVGEAPPLLSLGSRVGILSNGRITDIRYWRASTMLPSRTVAIWSDAGALLFSATATGVVGWNLEPVDPPLLVSAGDIIRVAYGYAGSGTDGSFGFTNSAVYADTANLDFLSGCYTPGTSTGFPDTIPTDSNYYADIVYQESLSGPPPFVPADIAGLTVWLDASVLGGAVGSAVSPWADLSGNGNDGAVVGTPAPKISTSTLNGLKVVRFAMNEGRIRGNTGINLSGLPAPGYNFSIIYVTRLFGPNAGRVFAGAYPEYTNFLVGYHTSQMDCAYDGAFTGGTPWSVPPTPWRMFNYSASHDGTNYVSDFYIDGTRIGGLTGSGAGLHNRYHLSGYSQTGTEETCDGEVAELLIYHRKLTDPERTQVHDYLQAKWGL